MAGSFQDAFIAAGLLTQEDIDKKKRAQEEAKRREKQREISRQQVKEMQEQDALRLKREKKPAENPFDRILRQSRNLMVHLIHAFSPFDKGQYAFTATDLKKRTCCICNCKLISKQELLEKSPQIAEASLGHLKSMIDGTLDQEKMKMDFSKVTGGAVLGVVSKDSNSAFCPECHREFLEWLSSSILKGNYQVLRVTNKMKPDGSL